MLVEYAESHIAIATRRPRFSWEVPLVRRGSKQTAYHLLVASSPSLLAPGRADLWDTGRVGSSQSVNVEYRGGALTSNRDYFWSVRLWDERDEAGAFSEPACFGTGLLDESDWHARWIGMGSPAEPWSDPDTFQQNRVAPEIAAIEPDPRSPMLRKTFTLDRKVRRARAFICGLGLFELRLNGHKVGDDVLATPRTDFRKRVMYSTYDITAQLVTGANALGLLLGNGWFNGQKRYWGWQMQWHGSPRAIVQVEIEFEDGSTQRIISDDSWRGDFSPITFNCIYDGEHYDARLEQPGWDTTSFDDAHWTSANLVSAPGGRLTAIPHEQGRIVETVRPVALREPKPGVYVFDFGQNMTGWIRLTVNGGSPGECVTIRYGEAQHANGELDASTNNRALQQDRYTIGRNTTSVYQPRFTYHGFQYVEITGLPARPDLDSAVACFVRTDVKETGSFECGNELLNRIHRCTLQSQRCNFQMGVPTDDTQRPERLGWAGDAWSYAVEALYNFDAARVFAKWIADFYDQQDDTGMVGMIVPQAGPEEDLVWSAAFILMPWWQYLHCGDKRLLEESYPCLQRYMRYLQRVGQKDIQPLAPDKLLKKLRWFCGKEERYPAPAERGHLQLAQWGDHLSTSEGATGARRNQPLSIATAFYYMDAVTMAHIAEALGKARDASAYRELAEQIKAAFNERFFDPASGYYDVGCQSAQAWPLAFGMVPEEHRAQVSDFLNSSVNHRQQRFTTGYAGTKWVIRAIADSGRHDILWTRAIATDYPSWGYMLRDPRRTTITENWAGKGSLCHTTLGAAIDEWFYWGLAGIEPDATGPGFEAITFKPYLPPDLPWATASLRTPRGVARSAWKHDRQRARLEITVPANSRATVHLPSDAVHAIAESGVPLADARDVRLIESSAGQTVCAVGSGAFEFEFPIPSPAAHS